MGEIYPNLIDSIQKYIPAEFVGKMSSLLGESREKTNLGIQSGLSGLMGGLADTASTADGARNISSAVNEADENVLGNVGKMFSRSSTSPLGGTTMLRSIFS